MKIQILKVPLILSFLLTFSYTFAQQKKTFPLVTAAAKGDITTVKSYIKKGEDINQKNRARWTALAYAVKYDYSKIVEYLVENGADINLSVNTGETPLQVALKNGFYDIAKYLVAQGADVNKPDLMKMSPLAWAVKERSMDKVKFLVQNGADVNQQNISGRTPLDMCDDKKISDYLASKGAVFSEDKL